MIIKVDNIRDLLEEQKLMYLCEKTGYSFHGKLNTIKEGQQADVYLVKRDNKEYVLKYYGKSWSVGGYGDGFFDEDGVFEEADYQQEVKEIDECFKIEQAIAKDELLKSHPNIVSIIMADKITFSDGVAKQTEWYSIMEKYQPLSLDGNASPNIRNEKEVLRLGVQICDALILLNSRKGLFNEASKNGNLKGILHGDIKFDNIFCMQEDSTYKYVLSDFGLSKLKGSKSSFSRIRGGTLYAMAPEMVARNYSTKVDLYALCATLYLLLNKGNEKKAQPRARVGEDVAGNFVVVYRGNMAPPKNASEEMKALLINALEFDSEKRNCKSAEELKVELQRIQFKHAVKAYKQNKMKLYEAYMNDLNESEIADMTLISDIGEFLISSSKYAEAQYYIKKACFAENPKGLYLDGVMWRDGLGCSKDKTTAKKRFIRALEVSKGDPELKKATRKALQDLEENDELRKQKIEEFEQAFPKRNILKLLCLCTLIIGSMGSCLVVSLFVEESYVYIVSSIATIALAFGLSVLCRVGLKKSAYASIAADIIFILLVAKLNYFGVECSEYSVIWAILIIVICAILVFLYLALFDDIYISPIRITNYLVCSGAIFIGAGLRIKGYELLNLKSLEIITDTDVVDFGTVLLIAGVILLFFKVMLHKESQGIIRKKENRYTIFSLLLIIGIVISIYLSIHVLTVYWAAGELLLIYVIGMIWVKKHIAEKRKQKYVWLISILVIMLSIVILQFAALCSDGIIRLVSTYIEETRFLNNLSINDWSTLLKIIVVYFGMCTGSTTLMEVYGMIAVTFFKPEYKSSERNKFIEFMDNVSVVPGVAGVMYIVIKCFRDGGTLSEMDCVIIGGAFAALIIYGFVCNFVFYKIMNNKNTKVIVMIDEETDIRGIEINGYLCRRMEGEDLLDFFNKRAEKEIKQHTGISLRENYVQDNIKVVSLKAPR